MEDFYKGYIHITLEDEDLAKFYNGDYSLAGELKDNEYILIHNKDGALIDKFRYNNGFLNQVKFTKLGNEFTGIIKPRNPEQELAFDMIKNPNTAVKLITGKWGSGKTLILCNAALEAIENGKFEKIVWIRNNVQVKDTDPLGSLPGTSFDKMLPYVMPLADHCGGIEGVERLLREGKLEVIPLAFLRGRNIRNAIIISSEAENLTKEHIQLLLGRVDEGSNLWLDADLKQRDRVSFEKSQGIETMIEKLAGQPLFGYVHLVKSERSAASRLADLMD